MSKAVHGVHRRTSLERAPALSSCSQAAQRLSSRFEKVSAALGVVPGVRAAAATCSQRSVGNAVEKVCLCSKPADF